MSGVQKKRGRPRIRDENTSGKKSGQGIAFKGQSRQLVCNVREYFEREAENGGPLLPISRVVARTAAAIKVSEITVMRISKEKYEKEAAEAGPSCLDTPGKKRNIQKRVTNLDPFAQDAIRRHIYSYYHNRKWPTLDRLHTTLREAELFEGSKSSLRIVLQDLGFKYKNISGRKMLFEREDIAAWRCRFLREMKDINFEDIVWIDETWVNAGHTVTKGWSDDKEGIALPTGKGGRIILLHAGTCRGFIPGCQLLFRSKKTSEYHEEMNHETFLNWFKNTLLPSLEKPSVIILDNAPYHSVLKDKAPNLSSRKEDIVQWLREHKVTVDDALKKVELIELVSRNKPQFPTYVIDEVAYEYGHRVIRLPPYHCHYNAIELIWAQVKGYVARENKKFTVSEVEKLTIQGLEKVTEMDWRAVVMHTKKVIDEAWKNEGLLEDSVAELIITSSCSSTSEGSDDSGMSGIHPLSDDGTACS